MWDEIFEAIGEIIAWFFMEFLPEILDGLYEASQKRKHKKKKKDEKERIDFE